MPQRRIIVAEPTYADAEHGPGNAGLLEAIRAGCGPVRFAATRAHFAAVREAADPGMPEPPLDEITVLPPGGVHLRRMWAQWQALAGLVRTHAPDVLVLLSAGPETLFVARALVTRHSALRIFAVMHGNLATAVGWRSRDPRRRLIDLRSSLRVAQHPRIRLVVLESLIRQTAMRLGLGHDFLVWPNIVPEHEAAPITPWAPAARLRVAFIGTAHRHKGFDDFIALSQACAANYAWALVGRLGEEYAPDTGAGIERPQARLSRGDFLHEVRRADYAFMAFRPEYELTSSGSLLDCIIQRKPIIAVENPMLADLARTYGPIGHVRADLAAIQALLAEPERLRDPAAYAGFQRALDSIARDRRPKALASAIAGDLGC